MLDARQRDGFVVSSWVFARLLGVTLLIAFVSIGVQAQGLFGPTGIAPIADFVASAQRAGHSFFVHPSFFWFWSGDGSITTVWVVGAIAGTAMALGVLPGLAALVGWAAYLSFVAVGWPFMSFQWDTLLLEVTFTSMFFVPWCVRDRLRTHCDPNPVARWALWFLLFRLVFRSAWVKLASGDATWQDLTALEYHYFTQPLPTVFAWYADKLPGWFQKTSCALMFVIEFGAPFLLVVPRASVRRTGAALIAALMGAIALTGNYGFFNLLTVLLCLTALDDGLLSRFFGRRLATPASERKISNWKQRTFIGPAVVILIAAIVFFGGTFGERRRARFLSPLYAFATFNNYGLFAVMTTTRPEIVLEGTLDWEHWEPYVFRYKPGPVERAPVWVAPHQPRLDWQMWFAALGDFRRNYWLAHTMRRLLDGEPEVLDLLETNPFEKQPPRQIRALVYEYSFTTADDRRETGAWWSRGEPKLYAPVLGEPPPTGGGAADPATSTEP
ncbi:MAG: lipase maturation factor family protein [Myxococcota bacterium]